MQERLHSRPAITQWDAWWKERDVVLEMKGGLKRTGISGSRAGMVSNDVIYLSSQAHCLICLILWDFPNTKFSFCSSLNGHICLYTNKQSVVIIHVCQCLHKVRKLSQHSDEPSIINGAWHLLFIKSHSFSECVLLIWPLLFSKR